MRFHFLTASILATASAFAGGPAFASGPGDTVTCLVSGVGSFSCSSASAVIGPSQEFSVGINGSTQFIGVDFGTNTLTLSAFSAGALSLTTINFMDRTTPFQSFQLLSNNGWNSYDVANSSLKNGILSIDLRGTNFSQGANLNFSLASVGGAVPEPATWTLMLVGFGAVGVWMRWGAAIKRKGSFA